MMSSGLRKMRNMGNVSTRWKKRKTIKLLSSIFQLLLIPIYPLQHGPNRLMVGICIFNLCYYGMSNKKGSEIHEHSIYSRSRPSTIRDVGAKYVRNINDYSRN